MTQDEIYSKALICMEEDANLPEEELYDRLILSYEEYRKIDCNDKIYPLYQHLQNLRGNSVMDIDALRDEISIYNRDLIREIAFLQSVTTSDDIDIISEDLLDERIEEQEYIVEDGLSYNGCEEPNLYDLLLFCEENKITMKVDKESAAYDDMWSSIEELQYNEPKTIMFGHPQTLLFGLENEPRDVPLILDYGENIRLAYS